MSFEDALKDDDKASQLKKVPVAATEAAETDAYMRFLFAAADCFYCFRRIKAGEIRRHCFGDRCVRCDICPECFEKRGHEHNVFAERVWLPVRKETIERKNVFLFCNRKKKINFFFLCSNMISIFFSHFFTFICLFIYVVNCKRLI